MPAGCSQGHKTYLDTHVMHALGYLYKVYSILLDHLTQRDLAEICRLAQPPNQSESRMSLSVYFETTSE